MPRFSPGEMRGLLTEALDRTDDEPESLVDRVVAYMKENGVEHGRTVLTVHIMADFDLSREDAESVKMSAVLRIQNEHLQADEQRRARGE